MVNNTIYIFGNLNNGYTQYPDNYASEIYQRFFSMANGKSQIVIHRNNDLMYYGYIRKLDQTSQYIGFCVLLNGVIYKNPSALFPIFENAVADLVAIGRIISFNEEGEIVAQVNNLSTEEEEIERISGLIRNSIGDLASQTQPLPPVDYALAIDERKVFSIGDNSDLILEATYKYAYTSIIKDKGSDTRSLSGYKGIIKKNRNEIKTLNQECEELKRKVTTLKNKQRNTKWVLILSLISIALFGVVYIKVINPTEVTKKDMGQFLYYGPMSNGLPNGTGVAIYHNDDKDGRLYYYGNFADGKRIDQNAIMFYKDGSYFRGDMNEDKWVKGMFFDMEKEHFIGEFKDNKPWNGTWYKHIKVQTIKDGI